MTGNAGVIQRALEYFNERRWVEFGEAYAEDAVITYPQSGERLVGRERILRMVEAFPSAPRFAPTAIEACGDMVVAEVDVDYGSGAIWKGVFLYWLESGRVRRESAYFAAPFEAAQWRAPFVEV